MKRFFSYVKQQKWNLILYGTMLLFFLLIPFLYDLPLYAVEYAAVLSLIPAICIFLYQFYRFKQKENTLSFILKSDHQLEKLPEAETPVEELYQDLLFSLYQEKEEVTQQAKNFEQESMDYYTMWVHQIKTPISAMHLILQENENDSNSNRELSLELFKIEQYAEMALQYMRLNSSSTDYSFEIYDLDTIMRSVIRKYAPLFIRKKIAIDYQNLNHKVITDEKWLSFVLEQIISNAIKYTKTGSIRIYMDKTKKNTLVIEDTGIGITPEDLPRIFERGYTGYNGRMDKKATGIGLYLTKQIVKNLSHRISITSKVGVGTKVFLDFSQYDLKAE